MLRCVGGGAQTQLDTFKGVKNDTDSAIQDKDNYHFKHSFKSIKNVMSDRRATQKKFERLFTEFRFSILPDVIFNSNVEM